MVFKQGFYFIQIGSVSSIGRFEAFPDNMTADEILAQAQAAAQDARDMLNLKPNKTKVGPVVCYKKKVRHKRGNR